MSVALKSQLATDSLVVSVTRIVEAPPQQVFDAFTRPDVVRQWWGPRQDGQDFTTPTAEMDVRPGGRYRIGIRSPHGDDYWMQGQYKEVDAPELLMFTHAWEQTNGQSAAEGLISVEFGRSGKGTIVSFTKSGFDSTDARDSEIEGWHEALDRLVLLFAKKSSATAPSTDDEAQLRKLIADWSRALERKDVEALVAPVADDAVLFDVKPPYRVDGKEGYRQLWSACLPCFPDGFRSEHRDVKLVVDGDLAFMHGLHHMTPKEPDHPIGRTWIRVTACYRKTGGQWQVVHEHVSIPFNPMNGMSAPITNADDLMCGVVYPTQCAG